MTTARDALAEAMCKHTHTADWFEKADDVIATLAEAGWELTNSEPWALFILHRHGEDLLLFETEASAREFLVGWADQWWNDEVRGKWKGPGEEHGDPPDDPDELVATYFEVVETEWFWLDQRAITKQET